MSVLSKILVLWMLLNILVLKFWAILAEAAMTFFGGGDKLEESKEIRIYFVDTGVHYMEMEPSVFASI